MVNKIKSDNRTKTEKKKFIKNSYNWKVIAIALYITFLLLSTIPFAADRAIEPHMKDSYEYHLRYLRDGRQTHYYVERVNTSKIGKIDLTYTTSSNSLDVDVQNVKVLHIFCRSMYEDECRKVYGIDPSDNSNYYKWYFIEKNHFQVTIDSDHEIEELSFIDTPFAYKVLVNNKEWKEGTDYFYSITDGIAMSNVPEGYTKVDLYFKPDSKNSPNAILMASKTLVSINENIIFDASGSSDSDGTIEAYILDLGDGTFSSKSTFSHYYSKIGTYGVILTVRDNDYLIDHAYVNITVVESSNLPIIQGVIPDQIKPEDSPPWSLNLSSYGPIPSSNEIEFYWYLTGEDTSLYSVAGENDTENRLIFTPEPDAYGNDSVVIWLHSNENLSTSQQLWINITPVNDPPTISSLPDLILHYDDPYTFNYEPYVNDKETPKHDLVLTVFDGYNKFITVNGLNATYNYPQELVGEIIYTTVTVSDGEDIAQDVITIQVTSDYVPKLVKRLPDVWLYEGTTKYNVFDLDDYFMDPDNDAIYFSFGQTHLNITININHTVDISADSEWTGYELVTFRARDPLGALAEDDVIVTVIPMNDPPVISGVPNFIIRYNEDYRFDLTPYVYDNDNSTHELTIIPSDPEHIRLDITSNMVIILNYPYEYLDQRVIVRLTVFDGLDSSFQDVTVTITEDFPPELLSPLPDIVFLEDIPLINAFDLDFYFLDVDGDVLYYTVGNEFIEILINTDHTVDFSAPQDWFGTEVVYFRATDPTGALQQDLVTVNVLPVNDPPNILDIPPQYGNESERWTLDLEPYIFDVDNNISELEISVDSELVVVSGSTLIFLGSSELPKEIEILVSDGQFSDTQTIEVHLKFAKGPTQLTLWDLFMNILPFLLIIILIIVIISGVVYHKKSRFIAEEVFLIHKGGTLINHLTRHKQANVDDVIFSGMFTAVQEFIKDTFTQDSSSDVSDDSENKWLLDELKLGDNKILIERSKNTFLAVIFSGDGSKRLRRIVNRLLDKIEKKYALVLSKWDGNITELAGTKEILSELIKPTDEPIKKEETQYTLKEPEPTLEQLFMLPEPTHTQERKAIMPPKAQAVSLKTISQPIAIAKPVVKSKELLNCTGEQTGVDQPGLLAWKLHKSKGKIKITKMSNLGLKFKGDGIERLPIALNISPSQPKQKTIAMKKIQPSTKTRSPDLKIETSIPRTVPSRLNIDGKREPVKINLPSDKRGISREYKIDPNRSLLHQLAELDEHKD